MLRAGNRVRITAQLIHGSSDEHLWSSSYERSLDDILALQNEVAAAIAEEIKITMTPGERARLAESRKMSPEAYEWYLRGNDYLRTASYVIAGRKTELQQAVKVYQQAIELDHDFAAAHARLSYTYTALYFYHEQSPDIARSAESAVERALELDATLPEAHLALGYYHNLVNRNYDQALKRSPLPGAVNEAAARSWRKRPMYRCGRANGSGHWPTSGAPPSSIHGPPESRAIWRIFTSI